ncbi:MAG: NosD domain-containing protein, partial [Candidatus Thorarchaeota archaeon]
SMNTVQDCTGVGIDVESSENITISWNNIRRNVDYALLLSDTSQNFDVSCNIFEGNGETCQVCDDGINNQIRFNYYSDWNSPDIDTNGIVDTPYSIDGAVGNADPYPLTEAGVVPKIEEPTTTPTETGSIPMDLVLLGAGAIAVLVIISGAVILRKR